MLVSNPNTFHQCSWFCGLASWTLGTGWGMHDSGYIYLKVQQRDCLDDKNLYIIIHMIKERKDLSVQRWEIDWTLLADNDGWLAVVCCRTPLPWSQSLSCSMGLMVARSSSSFTAAPRSTWMHCYPGLIVMISKLCGLEWAGLCCILFASGLFQGASVQLVLVIKQNGVLYMYINPLPHIA